MSRGPLERWRQRGGRGVSVLLPFDDMMEFALALLSMSPTELETLGWRFADRKRLLDHFLEAGKAAQGTPADQIARSFMTVRLPQRDVDRLRRFASRELPKAASNAAVLDRVLAALESASHRRTASKASDGF
jgi:hypothetical protein